MWQRRFFTLKGDMPAFYNTEEESSSGQPPNVCDELDALLRRMRGRATPTSTTRTPRTGGVAMYTPSMDV